MNKRLCCQTLGGVRASLLGQAGDKLEEFFQGEWSPSFREEFTDPQNEDEVLA